MTSSSRLDRLYILLETGSSPITRAAAAKQLGEVQRLHPHELNTLLGRTGKYLRSPSWETRLAAADAIRAIANNVPQWNPPPLQNVDNEITYGQAKYLSTIGRLRFGQFDLRKILTCGVHLMTSDGSEFDPDDDSSPGVDLKDKLAGQRQLLNIGLGLQTVSYTIDVMASMFSQATRMEKDSLIRSTDRKPLSGLPLDRKPELSSREINRARRKARQAYSKQRSREPGEEADEPERKKLKPEDVKPKEENYSIVEPGDCVDWPFESFCDQLCLDLFSSNWEYRHGAATALREIISVHGNGAGMSVYYPQEQMQEQHQMWLEDMAIRLICVLALDRFGDFVSDAVVAPVRETCAQALCAVIKLMTVGGCNHTLDLLMKLLDQDDWEGRHGGLLGLKYLLAVRQDMIAQLFRSALSKIIQAMSDPADDVGAVAASALIPVASKLLELVPERLPEMVDKLWDLLSEQDELAGACNSFMGLLAAILSLKNINKHLPLRPLRDVVPRLWPFLIHSASAVRKATLQTLGTLTEGHSLRWDALLLQEALRHVFQRVLVEHLDEVRAVAESVWLLLLKNAGLADVLIASCPYMRVWLCLAMQPIRIPFEPGALIHAKPRERRRNDSLHIEAPTIVQKYYIGGSETTPVQVREQNAVDVRCRVARMLGELSCLVVQPAPGVAYSLEQTPIDFFVFVLLPFLNSKSGMQRLVVGLVISEWAIRDGTFDTCPEPLQRRLHACLNEVIYFDEIAHSFTRLAQETRDFIATMKHYRVPIDGDHNVLTLDIIKRITGKETEDGINSVKLKSRIAENLNDRRKLIQTSAIQTNSDYAVLQLSTQAGISGATVSCKSLPDKLTPVVKPLMDSIQRERSEQLQGITAKRLAHLVQQCIGRVPCPNDKIICNLSTFLKCDPEFTPSIDPNDEQSTGEHSWFKPVGNYQGIVTLDNQQRYAERAALKRTSSLGRGPGRPPNTDIPLEDLLRDEDDDHQAKQIQRRGATYALMEITKHFESELPFKVPKLWDLMVKELEKSVDLNNFSPAELRGQHKEAELLVCVLQVLEITFPSAHPALRKQIMAISLARLCVLLTHPYRSVRHMAARCLAVLAKIDSVVVMEEVIARVLPLLGSSDNDIHRQGAVEAIACMVDALQFDIIPYVVLLVVPLLGRMSDQNQCVRLMGTHSFATLIQLMPLDGGVPEPPKLKTSTLCKQRAREREFLQQLLSPTTIPDYELNIRIDAELRNYQQAGVNWLSFLNKYKLHGILCDDMGLGKTLQSICILAGDHHARSVRYSATKSADSVPLQSLVVCPPTLTGHWVYEVEKFLPDKNLKPIEYHGSPQEREKLRQKNKDYNLFVASYDIVRKDVFFFRSINWNYIILDEGHVIKNGKTRTSLAVKQLNANHRLILSGTPIQNNVLEIWSLFDFLMPGFLGTEKQFTARFSKPILASRDPKCSQKEQEAGALAMEALHRQVLPFVLRRMKEDVLDDLPPKITQDYYCDLSPIQAQLYEDFSKSHAHQTLQQSLHNGATASSMQGNTHIFQALRYLQNVCNHPKLVLTSTHPQYSVIMKKLKEQDSTLESIDHSAKMPALKQLLLDCGIGVTQTQSTEIVINQHRALVFCQLKAMLDIIEFDLFRKTMPEVSFLRLDGSIPPSQRHSVVTRFNNDPSIDVLLLTTQVGGLGLNLTGADTVIFVEHDWNPMKDLQAMDRAHRIGQRKVVNVYRLITRGTLEEKIMGLQKFKVQTANTIISGDNNRMETMGTDQLLDLFSHKAGNSSNDGSVASGSGAGRSSARSIIDDLPELWDDRQYEDEYDLTQFISKLEG